MCRFTQGLHVTLTMAVLLLLTACPLPFLDKDEEAYEITSYSFKAAHNAALSEDISASISGDTISLSVPSAVELDGLIATYESTGDFITVGFARQASGVSPNNFNSTVKYRVHRR